MFEKSLREAGTWFVNGHVMHKTQKTLGIIKTCQGKQGQTQKKKKKISKVGSGSQ